MDEDGTKVRRLLPIIAHLGGRFTLLCGLIIKPVIDVQGQYVRVGVFEIWRAQNLEFTAILKDPSLGRPKDIDCVSVDPDESQEYRYLIDLMFYAESTFGC